ncbi:DoxX family protein [Gammaproteobacteria bacterium]|nr:DoxX family protein [Gammaproteobacteria bacterium]
MNALDNAIDSLLLKLSCLAPWGMRLSLGIAFIIHGSSKFPLPPQTLIEHFNFSPNLASFVALSEIFAGLAIIFGGFLKNHVGNLLTRFSALLVVIIMFNAFNIAHRDWFISPQLFTSEQIFLWVIGVYFLIKGNR